MAGIGAIPVVGDTAKKAIKRAKNTNIPSDAIKDLSFEDMLLFHGTKASEGVIWTTPNREVAGFFADNAVKQVGGDKHIIKLVHRMDNPAMLDITNIELSNFEMAANVQGALGKG